MCTMPMLRYHISSSVVRPLLCSSRTSTVAVLVAPLRHHGGDTEDFADAFLCFGDFLPLFPFSFEFLPPLALQLSASAADTRKKMLAAHL